MRKNLEELHKLIASTGGDLSVILTRRKLRTGDLDRIELNLTMALDSIRRIKQKA